MMYQGIGVDPTALKAANPDGSYVPEFEVGSHYEDDQGLIYKYVRYDTGAGAVAAVSGQVAYYYLAGGFKNSVVTSDLSDSVNLGAGVLKSAPVDGQYCWIQIGGPATLTASIAASSDGDPLTPDAASDGSLASVTVATSQVCAYADDASAAEIICAFPF